MLFSGGGFDMEWSIFQSEISTVPYPPFLECSPLIIFIASFSWARFRCELIALGTNRPDERVAQRPRALETMRKRYLCFSNA